MLDRVNYTVKDISGDYAILVTDSGIENTVALFFLPMEIEVGTALIYENLEYRLAK